MSCPRCELYWAAGFFDGEGCISRNRTRSGSRYYVKLRFTVTQASKEPLDRFQEAVGVGRVYGPYISKRIGRKPIFQWEANGRADVERLIHDLIPILSEVKRQDLTRALSAGGLSNVLPAM